MSTELPHEKTLPFVSPYPTQVAPYPEPPPPPSVASQALRWKILALTLCPLIIIAFLLGMAVAGKTSVRSTGTTAPVETAVPIEPTATTAVPIEPTVTVVPTHLLAEILYPVGGIQPCEALCYQATFTTLGPITIMGACNAIGEYAGSWPQWSVDVYAASGGSVAHLAARCADPSLLQVVATQQSFTLPQGTYTAQLTVVTNAMVTIFISGV